MTMAARGRRDPALAARMRGEVEAEPEYDYFVGRRPLKVGDETRQPGDPIPEAAEWPRRESWLSTGAIVRRPHVPAAPAPEPDERLIGEIEKPAARQVRKAAAVPRRTAQPRRTAPKPAEDDAPHPQRRLRPRA